MSYCSENFYVLFFRIAKYNFTCQAKSPMQNHQYTTNTKIYRDIITKKKSNKLTSWFVENSLKYDCPCKKGIFFIMLSLRKLPVSPLILHVRSLPDCVLYQCKINVDIIPVYTRVQYQIETNQLIRVWKILIRTLWTSRLTD